MTRDDRRHQGVPVFRDFGHSLSIVVTDKVLPDPKTKNAAPVKARHHSVGLVPVNLAPGTKVLLDSPCS